MELRHLRDFVAIAEERHFGRAAARLMIASPSLSQQIKALERQLSLRLFDRTATGATLTAAGERLLPLARAALTAADDVRVTAERLVHERATVLRLGFLAFALTAQSRRLLAGFGRDRPQVSIEMRQYEWDDPSAGLLSGQTDAALVRPPFTGVEALHLLELGREPLLAVLAEDHPLVGEAGVTTQRLAREPVLEADVATDPVLTAYWYLREHRPPGATVTRSRAETVEEWLAEVSFGRGVNVLPAGLASQYRRPGLAFVPIIDAPPSTLALAWHRDHPPEAAVTLAQYAATRAWSIGPAE